MARQNPYEIFQLVPEIYPKLVQYRNGNFYDGAGNLITISQVINPDNTKLLISDGTKSGIVTVPTLSWNENKLNIKGGFKLQDGSESNGYILVSDADGNASWTSSISGSVSVGAEFYYQNTTPTPNNVGARWFNSDTGLEFVWIFDGTTNYWVQPTQLWNAQYATSVISTSTATVSFAFEYYGITNTTSTTITLPLGVSPQDDGKFLMIKDETGISRNTTTTRLRIQTQSSQTIGSGTTYITGFNVTTTRFTSFTLLFRNGRWHII